MKYAPYIIIIIAVLTLFVIGVTTYRHFKCGLEATRQGLNISICRSSAGFNRMKDSAEARTAANNKPNFLIECWLPGKSDPIITISTPYYPKFSSTGYINIERKNGARIRTNAICTVSSHK